ncbi:MAG: pyruvate, phosphate dikinase [Candidatus Nitrohelix vancouverensis]|uniref:Pyruvate, phosphate dikinase n=1 Tax=Candidatus Nitrohelix vancouverensis TaxID=2705534 RepID=A0A7T0C0P9_9BACT|nr:MAG: pyruvate, phosphate dikinase [Candidatus Nitrohelix vancouverensis]
MSKKYLYFFSGEETEGNAEMRDLLGGKGANLAEMASLGIAVPPGFTITTEACLAFFKNDSQLPPTLWTEVKKRLAQLEKTLNKKFGDPVNPLLVSVRSGARESMPGMMDTVLNLGLNDDTARGLAESTGNEWFANDCHRRFIAMFANVALGVKFEHFEAIMDKQRKLKQVEADTELQVRDLKTIISKFKAVVKKQTGSPFPDSPIDQLKKAIEAVFHSWNSPRAITYRKIHAISHDWGTAVNVQAMVFGNMGDDSATGVAFTRNPATGEKKFFGEYMINAQGEDVVAGIRTPSPISELEAVMPEVYEELVRVYQKLENHYKDMQDLEFTIENRKLFLLQTRSGKRTAPAAIKVAVDMVGEGLISKREAVMRVSPGQLDQIFHPMIDPNATVNVLAKGLGASPGAAFGKIVFTPEGAQLRADKKEKVILVRAETSPEDIHGMNVSQGILTAKGGMTSHAAVVARAMGKPCVSGCSNLDIDMKKKRATLNGTVLTENDSITLDGANGQVIAGEAPLIQPRLTSSFARLMNLAGEFRTLQIRANADTPHDALVARDFGAQGIGLCRTEHMFFNKERILLVRRMICSQKEKDRAETLKKLLPIQRNDFTEIFRVMDGLPVTIRLLDPPLHEFLPSNKEDIKVLAKEMKISATALAKQINSQREINPMLGLRGCRLGIAFPEIYRMQARAILEAASKLIKKGGKIYPEIMIPLVSHVNEFVITRDQILEEAEDVQKKTDIKLPLKIGTMIELPRAALTADAIGREADFFSFGTNDLTQTSYGISRDDSAGFLPNYLDQQLLEEDPFVSVDQDGVGELIKIAIEKGKGANKKLHLGICGEHGGDPKSITFFNQLGLDYVSCSPFRVPTALLAAAQAAIEAV